MAAEVVVVATLTPAAHARRRAATSPHPGESVRALVTDLGTLEKPTDGELVLTAVPDGDGTVTDRDRAVL